MSDTSNGPTGTCHGSCHCGAVQFEVELENGLDRVHHCNCSMCRRRSAYVYAVSLEKLKVVSGEENLTLYQWGTNTAKHYFCKTCGIYTHHQRRSNPNQFSFNIACLDGVIPFDYGPAPVGDGINHVKDQK